MFELLGMSIKIKTIQEEIIAKKREQNYITTLEITGSPRVGLESKLKN